MKCRFEHDGECCNSGARLYMCYCRTPCDTIVPLNNADRIRAMSDEELAKFIVGNAVGEEYQTYEYEFSIENVRYFNVDYEHQGETAEDSVLYWLKQPADLSYDKTEE